MSNKLKYIFNYIRPGFTLYKKIKKSLKINENKFKKTLFGFQNLIYIL